MNEFVTYKSGDLIQLQSKYGRMALHEEPDAGAVSGWIRSDETYIVIDSFKYFVHCVNTTNGKQGWCRKMFIQKVEQC